MDQFHKALSKKVEVLNKSLKDKADAEVKLSAAIIAEQVARDTITAETAMERTVEETLATVEAAEEKEKAATKAENDLKAEAEKAATKAENDLKAEAEKAEKEAHKAIQESLKAEAQAEALAHEAKEKKEAADRAKADAEVKAKEFAEATDSAANQRMLAGIQRGALLTKVSETVKHDLTTDQFDTTVTSESTPPTHLHTQALSLDSTESSSSSATAAAQASPEALPADAEVLQTGTIAIHIDASTVQQTASGAVVESIHIDAVIPQTNNGAIPSNSAQASTEGTPYEGAAPLATWSCSAKKIDEDFSVACVEEIQSLSRNVVSESGMCACRNAQDASALTAFIRVKNDGKTAEFSKDACAKAVNEETHLLTIPSGYNEIQLSSECIGASLDMHLYLKEG